MKIRASNRGLVSSFFFVSSFLSAALFLSLARIDSLNVLYQTSRTSGVKFRAASTLASSTMPERARSFGAIVDASSRCREEFTVFTFQRAPSLGPSIESAA